MPDAIEATVGLMEADAKKLSVRSSYNIAGMSFSPNELADEIKTHIPDFICTYKPDNRQKLASGWPRSIDDSAAKKDWGWKPTHNLSNMTIDMLDHLQLRKEITA